MKDTENQAVMSSREKIKQRLSTRYPDKSFVGQDGNEDTNAIDDSLEEMLGEYERGAEEYNENSKKLTNLFAGDPRSAQAFTAWAHGGNLLSHLVENFGDDFKAALESEEGKEQFLEAHNKWLDKVANNRKAEEEADANFKTSIQTLEAFQSEHNLTDEEAIAVFDKVHTIGSEMVKGIYTTESFLMAYKAMHHDGDVASARAEGEIAGRNTRIKEKLNRGDKMNLPPTLSGQGSSVQEKKPKQNRRTALDYFGLND